MNRHSFLVQIFVLLVIFSMLAGCTQATATPQPSSLIPSATSTPPAIELPSLTPEFTSTPVNTNPVWGIKENWSAANQIRAMLIDQNGDLWTGGPAGLVHWDLKTNTPTVYAIKDDPESTNVIGLSQTPDGSIWVGTHGYGLARFDGNIWQPFTKKDGLPGDFIIAQTATSQGELWLAVLAERQTINSAQFGHLNGTNWIQENGGAFDRLVTLQDDSIVSVYNEGPISGIYVHSYIGIYDGQDWNVSNIYPTEWIDAITVAPDGVIWFATDNSSVYHYIQQKWIKMTPPWAGKDFTRVSSIAVSKNNTIWVGFSRRIVFDNDTCGDRDEYDKEQGVYRYDGKWWMHFTASDGLIDNKICAITIDANNNVWFGSFDKGVSRFDGKSWTSYVIP